MTDKDNYAKLARCGAATVYEASGRQGLIDIGFIQVVPGSRVCGPARPVRCGQDDQLMVHAAIDAARRGDVLVLTMPEPRPVALVGDLVAAQAMARGVAALLIDAAVCDIEELPELGLPIWARWIRIRGPGASALGTIDEPIMVGGARIAAGDAIVLDADGAAVVPAARVGEVIEAAHALEERERAKRAQVHRGALSYDFDGLRERVEGP
jgi:4-hydroxy-4-methyl-2-oxoglutarate aldolase